MTPTLIDHMRIKLKKLAHASHRGDASTVLSRQVLAAFAASTREEYFRRMSLLPVAIESTPFGTTGDTRKDYFVAGKYMLSGFFVAPPDITSTAAARDFVGQEAIDSAYTESVPAETEPELCEDEEGWDACATTEDIDAGFAAIAAVDAEVAAAEAELIDAEVQYCSENPEDEDECPSEATLEAVAPEMSLFEADEGGAPFLPAGSSLHEGIAPTACIALATLSPTTNYSGECAVEGVLAGFAVYQWVESKVDAIQFLNSVSSGTVRVTARALSRRVFGHVMVGFAAGYAVGSAINCYSSK